MIIENFKKEKYYYIESESLDEDLQWLIDKGIYNNIVVSSYKGYKINNINRICEVLNEKLVTISLAKENIDLAKLMLCKRLEYLHVTGDNYFLDFSYFVYLKILRCKYNVTYVNLEYLTNLEELHVWSATDYVYECIKKYQNLKILELVQAKKFGLDKIISDIHKIEHLELCYIRDVIDLQYLLPIKDTLKELRIQNCKNIINFEFISFYLLITFTHIIF
jgi:hypothetical protein